MATYRPGVPVKTRSGRKVKPTFKVRELFVDALLPVYQGIQTKLLAKEKKLRVMMAAKKDPARIKKEYEQWSELQAELQELNRELSEYMSVTDYEAHMRNYSELVPTFVQLYDDLELYQQGLGPGVLPKFSSNALQQIKKKTSMIESEIDRLEQELTKSKGKVKTQARTSEQERELANNSTPKSDEPRAALFNPSISTVESDRENDEEDSSSTVSRDTVSSSSEDRVTDILDRLVRALESKQTKSNMKLPEVEPEQFAGDLLEFPSWWNSFECMVEKHTASNQERLFFLNKYTSGKAKESIKGFSNLYNDEEAYEKAKGLILSRFGNKMQIAEAYKLRLSSWSVIKKGENVGLQKYSDFLWQCAAAMKTLEYMTNLNSQEENLKLVEKLPTYMQERWDRIVDSCLYGNSGSDHHTRESKPEGPYPNFDRFCRFVSGEARVANGPRVAQQDRQKENKEPAATKDHSHKRKSFNTKAETKKTATSDEAAESKAWCVFCKNQHPIAKCEQFMKNTSDFRKEFAKTSRLCFGCLRKGHGYRTCRLKDPSLLADNVQVEGTSMNTRTGEQKFRSMILPVWIHNAEKPQSRYLTYAVVDGQSDCCFVREDLMEKLEAQRREVSLTLTTMGKRCTVNSNVVTKLVIQGENESEQIELPDCYSRGEIPASRENIPRPSDAENWPHLKNVARHIRPVHEDIEIGLLLGFDCAAAMMPILCVQRGMELPYAVKTPLGWSVSGPLESEMVTNQSNDKAHLCFMTSAREMSTENIQRVFDVDFQGDTRVETKLSTDDMKFMKIVSENIKQLDDGHFQLPLPFREEPQDLPDSRPYALRCLMMIGKKMEKNPEFSQQYAKFMNGLVDSGQASVVADPWKIPVGKRWYWTHHGVVHPRKPGKIRGVFNGAKEIKGVALNSLLLTGPDQLNSMVGVLFRFRKEAIAITCDVEGMFLQVRVDPEHQQYLRFLWYEDGNPQGRILEYEMGVHLFGATSSPGCSNYALAETARRYADEYGEEAAEFVRDNFYVDDGLGSVPDVEAGVKLIHDSHGLCQAGGFNLHKYASSHSDVLKQIPIEWRAPSIQEIDLCHEQLPTEKTLGAGWGMQLDAFVYTVKIVKKPATRRGSLSALSSQYDPMGLVSAAILPGRILLKKMCAMKMTWDEMLPDEMASEWDEWYQQLADINQLTIPRCFRRTASNPLKRIELHTFCDASLSGYGACCYLLLADEEGKADVSLVYAKARVTPSKPSTIPRLELQSAVLAVKMAVFVQKELKYEDMKLEYWSDSKIALGYIKNDAKKFHMYVTNRLHFIKTRSTTEQWHHIKTGDNPADLASRGATAKELIDSDLWWHGPRQIVDGEDTDTEDCPVPEDDPEIKKEKVVLKTEAAEEFWGSMFARISRWSKLVRVVAYCQKFVRILRARVLGKPMTAEKTDVCVRDLEAAEMQILQATQRASFPDEFTTLLRNKKYPVGREQVRVRNRQIRQKSNLYKLDPFMSTDGVIRVGGRIKRADLPRQTAQPVILPRRHPVTEKIIRSVHQKLRHPGRHATHSALRAQGYWVIGGRSTVQRYVGKCVQCRRVRGKLQGQKMSDLPEARTQESPPFTHAAADFFGPIQIRQARSLKKRWICAFTCLSSRAVHIEPCTSLSTDSFLHAFRRFQARRGAVRTLRTDRGTNFVGACAELKKAMTELDVKQIREELRGYNCDLTEFLFNVPKASHMGGVWERMIRSVKAVLMQMLTEHGENMDDEMLSTLLAETECIVNSRPVTCLDATDPEGGLPLSPSQLLTLKTSVVMPLPGNFVAEDVYTRRRWRCIQHLANVFWQKWRRDYLPTLTVRQKWQTSKDNLRVDDVVLLTEDTPHRNQWPRGIVTEVTQDEEGLVRKVKLRVGTSVFDRPIHKLVLLFRPGDEH